MTIGVFKVKKISFIRIQCFPGKIGRFDNISAKIQPTDQMSTIYKKYYLEYVYVEELYTVYYTDSIDSTTV